MKEDSRRRPHQRVAIYDVLAGFRKHDRGQLIMACGTGKTAAGLWIKEDLDAQCTLVLIPSIALVDQFASEWRKFSSPEQQYASLCVCSDKTVGRNGGKDEDEDYDAVEFTAEDLAHDGFEVTSDAARIAEFMKQPGRRVIFSTYQSSHLIEEAQRDDAVPAFDLAIADEAHRCAGKRDSDFAIILDDWRIRASKRLFATATPKIQRTKNNEIENVADMSDEAAFGKVFHRLTLGSAIRQGILSDYRVFITQVDDPGLHHELNAKDESTKVQKRRCIQVSMLKTIREYGLQRVVTFHNRVEDAKLYADELPQVAAAVAEGGKPVVVDGTADYVSGKMSAEVRKRKMDVFREDGDGTCHVLSNARCLSEGVDVPAIDGVVFVDPRSSEIEIVQALGRAIRQHGDKEFGAIVVPVFVVKGQNTADAIERSSFKHVVDVLNALRAHDMEFGAALDGMRQRQANDKASEGEGDPFTKIKFDLRDVPGLYEALRPILLEALTDSFQKCLGYLKAFVVERGHCRVPADYKSPDGFNLWNWVCSRRKDKKSGLLAPKRIVALDELGFEWNPLEAGFQKGLAHLNAFKEEHGHCRVPHKYKTSDGFSLGDWVRHRRSEMKAGTLSPERIAALDEQGLAPQSGFQEGLGYLKAFKEEHGHCRASSDYKSPDGFNLGQWICNRRSEMKAGTLSPERIAVLDEQGFSWGELDLISQSRFLDGIDYLLAFKEEHGHCRVPHKYKTSDGFSLGIWVGCRRREMKAGTLSPERIAALDEQGFSWRVDVKEAAKEKLFAHARFFFEEFGHLRVPVSYKSQDGYDLYSNMSKLRHRKRNGGLAPEEIAEYDTMGVVWEPRKQKDAPPTPLPDLASRLQNEEPDDDLPELMAQHGCDLEESHALIETGNFDDALRLLEDATGSSLRLRHK